jgi:hypothetical protein
MMAEETVREWLARPEGKKKPSIYWRWRVWFVTVIVTF